MKRYLIPTLGVLVAIFVLDFVIHGILMKDLYEQTSTIWRPEVSSQNKMWIMWVGYLIFAPVFVFIFGKGHEKDKSKLGQGIRYGFLIWLLMGIVPNLVWYVVLPIPFILPVFWISGALIEFILAGIVVSLLYRE